MCQESFGRLFMSWRPHFPSSSLPVAWESSQGRPKALGPCTCFGDQEGTLGSRVWTGSALVIVATWRVNQQTEDLSLSFLYICLSNKNKIHLNKQTKKSWHGSLVAKSRLEHARVPYGHWFVSLVLRFTSSSLLVAWESSQGRPKALGPCTHMGDLEKLLAPRFRLAQLQLL